MDPVYILLKIDINGKVQASLSTSPEVPEMFVLPGEVAFTVQPLDVAARHSHGFVQ